MAGEKVASRLVALVFLEASESGNGQANQNAQQSDHKQQLHQANGLLLISIHDAYPYARMIGGLPGLPFLFRP